MHIASKKYFKGPTCISKKGTHDIQEDMGSILYVKEHAQSKSSFSNFLAKFPYGIWRLPHWASN